MHLTRWATAGMLGAGVVGLTLACSSDDGADKGSGACSAVCARSDVRACFNAERTCEEACREAEAGYGVCLAEYRELLFCLAQRTTAWCKDNTFGVEFNTSLCPAQVSALTRCTGAYEAGIYTC